MRFVAERGSEIWSVRADRFGLGLVIARAGQASATANGGIEDEQKPFIPSGFDRMALSIGEDRKTRILPRSPGIVRFGVCLGIGWGGSLESRHRPVPTFPRQPRCRCPRGFFTPEDMASSTVRAQDLVQPSALRALLKTRRLDRDHPHRFDQPRSRPLVSSG